MNYMKARRLPLIDVEEMIDDSSTLSDNERKKLLIAFDSIMEFLEEEWNEYHKIKKSGYEY